MREGTPRNGRIRPFRAFHPLFLHFCHHSSILQCSALFRHVTAFRELVSTHSNCYFSVSVPIYPLCSVLLFSAVRLSIFFWGYPQYDIINWQYYSPFYGGILMYLTMLIPCLVKTAICKHTDTKSWDISKTDLHLPHPLHKPSFLYKLRWICHTVDMSVGYKRKNLVKAYIIYRHLGWKSRGRT